MPHTSPSAYNRAILRYQSGQSNMEQAAKIVHLLIEDVANLREDSLHIEEFLQSHEMGTAKASRKPQVSCARGNTLSPVEDESTYDELCACVQVRVACLLLFMNKYIRMRAHAHVFACDCAVYSDTSIHIKHMRTISKMKMNMTKYICRHDKGLLETISSLQVHPELLNSNPDFTSITSRPEFKSLKGFDPSTLSVQSLNPES
jgi:hypothetical protein